MRTSVINIKTIRGVVVLLILLSFFSGSCTVDEVQPGAIHKPTHRYLPADSSVCDPALRQSPMVVVEGGTYVPIYGRNSNAVQVAPFMMDVYPVTNEQFLLFVKQNPKWRKSQVKELFGDANYLRNWKNDTTLGEGQSPQSPVTNVTWYAASAYCECVGKRLPTVDEWEYAAMADEDQPDARNEDGFTHSIIRWYESPETHKNDVGSTSKNYWGLYDMHGLVWEWTSDFNSVLVSGDSRKGTAEDNKVFCGGSSIDATDLRNYAAFMRYAFRGSLNATYSVQNLGFRCAADIPQ